MNIAVFHGSPRKGNTYHATKIFMDALSKSGQVNFTEYFFPQDLPAFCIGCTLCFEGTYQKCPNTQYITPILDTILQADALIFATPHYGSCSMPASMKTLFDHIDSLVLTVSPQAEMFEKKAFLITTGTGSAAAIKPMKSFLKHCGINRVYSLGFRMFTNKWDKMSQRKQTRYEKSLRRSAQKFYKVQKGHPYITTIFFYHMSKFVLRKYVGPGNYPYENWKEKGYFDKRPF